MSATAGSRPPRARDPSCLFCRIVAGELPSTRLAETPDLLAIRDIAPQAPTHVLILSRDHIASSHELDSADGPLLGAVFELAAKLAREEGIDAEGYRVVTNVGEAGGQSVPHLHVHVLGGRRMTWPPG